jgi:hypothetical protein
LKLKLTFRFLIVHFLAEWNPQLTTIVSIHSDGVLLECWSIRYELNVSESRGRIYSKLMVLVRSIVSVAQALPTSRNRSKNEISVRFCETDGEPYDVVPPLTEQFCFPSIDMAFGRIDIQVRYRNDMVFYDSNVADSYTSINRKDGPNLLGPAIVEDYIGRKVSGDIDNEEDDAENRRWRRWASESFDERERELNMSSERQEEDDDDEDLSAPPTNTRVSSNPMAIPAKHEQGTSAKRPYDDVTQEASSQQRGRDRRGVSPTDGHHFATSAPSTTATMSKLSRKPSGLNSNENRRGHSRASSEEGGSRVVRYSSSFGYSVADLVTYNSTGTPILSSLPFAVGSLASSAASISDASRPSDQASLRAKFLSGIDLSSTSPPFPVVFMSAGSLMVSRHSSALALLDNPAPSPSPQFPSAPLTPPVPAWKTQVYEAALPWVLTSTEMERPFSAMGASVTLGVNLDENPQSSVQKKKNKNRNNHDDEIEDDDILALPFVADEDVEKVNEDNNDLGAFVRRCREDRGILVGNEAVKIDDIRKQLDNLVYQAGIDRTQHQPEVVTVFEERAL